MSLLLPISKGGVSWLWVIAAVPCVFTCFPGVSSSVPDPAARLASRQFCRLSLGYAGYVLGLGCSSSLNNILLDGVMVTGLWGKKKKTTRSKLTALGVL